MTQHDPIVSLKQMRQFAQEAVDFAAGKTKEDLISNRLLILGLLHLLSTIGEAANRIPQDIRQTYPQIPWRAMIGMRNRLIHAYDIVDVAVVWLVVNDDLPNLMRQIDHLLSDLQEQS